MAEKEIAGPWSVFVEYAGDFAQQGGSKQITHVGTAYRITPKQQIDFHLGFGVSPAAVVATMSPNLNCWIPVFSTTAVISM